MSTIFIICIAMFGASLVATRRVARYFRRRRRINQILDRSLR